MSYYGFRPYVPVAKRRAIAARELEKLRKKGRKISPVVIEGRTIARTFWGKAWCENPPLVALYPLDQPLNAMDGRHECASRLLPTVRAVLHDDASGPIIPRSGILLRSCNAAVLFRFA